MMSGKRKNVCVTGRSCADIVTNDISLRCGILMHLIVAGRLDFMEDIHKDTTCIVSEGGK